MAIAPDLRPLRIARVSPVDEAGGAERVAMRLHLELLARGHSARAFVGERRSRLPGVIALDNRRRTRTLHGLGAVALERGTGLQYLYYPATTWLARALRGFDLVHLHNLHGGYFALHQLPLVCRGRAALLTLHDLFWTTGHCAQPVDCARWARGCGACPDLERYPSVRRDATALNRALKRRLLEQVAPRVIAPSRWIRDRWVEAGMPGRTPEVIYRGVALDRFTPAPHAAARAALDLPQDAAIVLFSALRGLDNPYKDGHTVLRAMEIMARRWRGGPLLLLVIGGGEQELPPSLRELVRFSGFISDEREVARHYQAADLVVHATRADTAPLVAIEAAACGRPVVASDVGGVPELVAHEETGFVVPPGDATAMAARVLTLLRDSARARGMGEAGRVRAQEKHAFPAFVDAIVALYRDEISRVEASSRRRPPHQ